MKYNTTIVSTLLILLSFYSSNAQSLRAVILDSVTQKPVPYATILLGNKGIISNEEGRFSFLLSDEINANDSIFISCIGYKSIGAPIREFTESSIQLAPKAIELKEVIVSNKNYTADDILELVKDRITKNYGNVITKKRMFYRQSNHNNWFKSNFKVKNSTIAVLNQQFIDSILTSIPKRDDYYSEILGDLYGDYSEESQKLNLLKASKLYNKDTELDMEKIKHKFEDILKKNVKKGSYFKVKSGILSFKVDSEEVSKIFDEEVDSTAVAALNEELEKKKKDKEEEQKNYAKWKKGKLATIMTGLPTLKNADLNFIYKTRKYDYTLKEFTYLGNIAVYVIDFTAAGAADYRGTLYINSDDFAVVQINYSNSKPIKKFNLLGVSANMYLHKGKLIYQKESNGFYGLKYYESENATRFGLKRSLKIIEKNKIVKGRNRQNEFSGKMDFAFNSIEKNELVIFESENISKENFDALKETNEILPVYMAKYNPEFWKGYTIMEPNSAIKEFTSEVAVETEK